MTETFTQQATDSGALPDGWTWTTVEELASTLKSGGTPSTKRPEFYEGDIPYAKVEDIVNAGKTLRSTKTRITQAGIDNSSAWVVPTGSLVYTMYASYGVPAITEIDVATNQAIIAFIPPVSLLSLDYVYYYLWNIKPTLARRIRGTTQANLNAGIVKSIEVPLPPLNEQHRIVEKIEELFTKLEAGVRGLEETRALLKSYRRSALKAAVEGELSREWREAHKDELEPASELLERILQERREKFSGKKYKEPVSPDTSKLPTLPDGWAWTSLDALCPIFTDCVHRTPKYSDEGYPALRPRDVVDGILALERVAKVPQEEYDRQNLRRAPQKGDVVYSRELSYGWAALVPESPPLCLSQGMVIFRPVENYQSSFLAYFLNSPTGRSQATEAAVGSAHPHVNLVDIRAYAVPILPSHEQRFIVEEVERRLSVVDKLEATIEANLKQAGGLRQSILKQAFSGALVPQDPNDEPASVLLERIRAEREAAKPKARKGRKSNATPTKRDHVEQEGLF